MDNTYIIGSGNLSNLLGQKISNTKIYSAEEFLNNIDRINKKKKINLIINSFYSSSQLKKLNSQELFVKKTLFEISKILDLLNPTVIKKIIYTSSASTYGIDNQTINLKDDNNRFIYAIFKMSAEFMIKNYCLKKNITFIICRIFNIYGGEDKFSILQKLKKAAISKKKIIIFNSGKSIRDFIHIDDVIIIYNYILKKKIKSGTYDIGTGIGIRIIDIIKKIKFKKQNLVYKKTQTMEIKKSVANNTKLFKQITKLKFKKIDDYLTCNNI